MIEITRLRDLAIREGNGLPGQVSSASGLVLTGSYLHVIADDSLHLASFRPGLDDPGVLTRLLRGELPAAPAKRKKAKPDFETLMKAPPSSRHPFGSLLALGSGSRSNRMGGVEIGLGPSGEATSLRVFHLPQLFETIGAHLPEVNIEGAVAAGDEIVLFSRGNAANPASATLAFPMAAFLAGLDNGIPFPQPQVRFFDIGSVDGVPWSFTDAAMIGGRIMFAAVAEDTANAYDDGAVSGSLVGFMSHDGVVEGTARLSGRAKIEGIDGMIEGEIVNLLLVSDADDPAQPSVLYSASFPAGAISQ